ncbi:MAG: hypothetical protein AAF957_14650 [Planctomycetota bacterium]
MIGLLPLALAGAALAAPVATVSSSSSSALRAVDELDEKDVARLDEFDDAYNEWRAELSRIRNMKPKEGEARPAFPDPPYAAFWPDFDGFATAGSSRAQVWCLQHFMAGDDPAENRADYLRRVQTIFDDPKADLTAMPRVLYRASRSPLDKDAGRELLASLVKIAKKPEVVAEAAYMRVEVLREREASDELLARMMDEYRAVAKAHPKTRYGKRAGGKVFKHDHLQIGMVAPDIVGKDVDGNPMKLSDFRGKVTVIDFWGFW